MEKKITLPISLFILRKGLYSQNSVENIYFILTTQFVWYSENAWDKRCKNLVVEIRRGSRDREKYSR